MYVGIHQTRSQVAAVHIQACPGTQAIAYTYYIALVNGNGDTIDDNAAEEIHDPTVEQVYV